VRSLCVMMALWVNPVAALLSEGNSNSSIIVRFF
jgi:hypothetical protein